MGQQASAAGPVRRAVPRVPVAGGRKGFKAELEDLRERMRGLGLGHTQIAGEIGRRYRVRPREAYRLAYGWTLDRAAARFNAHAAELGTDPQGRAALAGGRLCEYEKWPSSQRRPSVYVVCMLARLYDTDVLALLDLADHEHLPPQDRLALLRPASTGPSGPELSTAAAASDADDRQESIPGPGHAPGPPGATGQGMSLSLPYVPGRLLIEVSGIEPYQPGQPGTPAPGWLALVEDSDGPAASRRSCPSGTR